MPQRWRTPISSQCRRINTKFWSFAAEKIVGELREVALRNAGEFILRRRRLKKPDMKENTPTERGGAAVAPDIIGKVARICRYKFKLLRYLRL